MADRIPTPAEIASLTDAELRALAQQLGIGPEHVTRVTSAVQRAALRLVGANLPSPALVEAVRQASSRAIRREMQKVTRELIREHQAEAQGLEPGSMLRWQSVQDNRVCEDCEARHGSVQTYADWKADGLPGSQNTVCDGACRCELLPDDAFTGPYQKGDVRVEIGLETT